VNAPTAGLDLYWLPLGAGGHSVGWNGRIYEALRALLASRSTSMAAPPPGPNVLIRAFGSGGAFTPVGA
jgi:hypothetical protein